MADERIKVEIVSEYDDKGADAAIKDAKQIDKLSPTMEIDTDTSKPQGAFGKMKGSATDAFGSIGTMAASAGAAAGAAMIAFGVKAVGAFSDAALAAGKFSDASGLSVEDASRWVAVADDIGISAESMEKSLGKLGLQLGKNNPLLAEYGIELIKGKDGQADMNATMLHAIDVIRGVQDPTKKAELAQAALGKGWVDMAELIEQGSDTLKASMADVSDAQVIDAEEVEKAKRMRAAMDDLKDAVGDLSLVLGEDLVPMVTLVAEGLAEVVGPLMDVNQWTKEVALSFGDLIGIIDRGNKGELTDLPVGLGRMATKLDESAAVNEDLIASIVGGISGLAEAKVKTDNLARANDLLEDRIRESTSAYDELLGRLDEEKAFLNANRMFDELRVKAEEAFIAAQTGADDADAKAAELALSLIDAQTEVLNLGKTYDDLPPEKITHIQALIDRGSLLEAEQEMAILTRNRSMQVSIEVNGGDILRDRRFGPGGSGSVSSFAAPTVAPMIVNVNMPAGAGGVDVLRQISGQARRSGRRYGTPVVHYARR